MTPGATIAPVGQRRCTAGTTRTHRRPAPPGCIRLVGRSGHHRAEDEPAAGPGDEQVGVLAEPPEPAEVGHLAIDDGVVVGEGDRPLAGQSKTPGDLLQAGA